MNQRVEFTLYISPSSLASRRALRTMKYLLACYGEEQVYLEVVDLSREEPRGVIESIAFTPTLVQTAPTRSRILGELRSPSRLFALLRSAGLRPKKLLDFSRWSGRWPSSSPPASLSSWRTSRRRRQWSALRARSA